MNDHNGGELWIRESRLGQGGFGQVYLYRNKQTNDRIAVKRCGSELTDRRLQERWQQEIDIMFQINHDNVVKALTTPPELQPPNEPPVLAMEYCAGGDLRNLLVKSPCGLKETTVRWLVQNVASGIEHLHKLRITHRDIKPENIVISKRGPNERDTVYKIIDLGYAKSLFDASILHSFVGTMQYLAPELMSRKGYTRTVDFWSFGVVLHECITGIRPFLPTEVPFRWYEHVSKKQENDICIFYNIEGEIESSDKLVMPHRLCRTTQAFIEQFLRLMLRWDPDTRGGRVMSQSDERDKCWTLLENILKSPLLFIYSVPQNELLTYPVEEKHTVREVMRALERETGIPQQEMDLVFTNGIVPPVTCRATSLCGLDETPCLYLFRKLTPENSEQILPNLRDNPKEFPELVRFMCQSNDPVLPTEDQIQFMSQAVYYCDDKVRQFQRIQNAAMQAWMSLTKDLPDAQKSKGQLYTELHQLGKLAELCEEGFQFDLESYKAQTESIDAPRFESVKTIQRWETLKQNMADLKKQHEEQLNNWGIQLAEIQREIESVRIQTNFPALTQRVLPELQAIASKSLTIYRETRKHRGQDAAKKPTNKDMLECVAKMHAEFLRIGEAVHSFIRGVTAIKFKLNSLVDQLRTISQSIASSEQMIKSYQQKRQEDMWKFVRFAMINGAKDAPPSSFATPAFQTTMMISQNSLDAMKAVNKCETAKIKAQAILELDENAASSTADWSFLNGDGEGDLVMQTE